MSTAGQTDGEAADGGIARRLGLSAGDVVQELGYDDDVDEAIRDAVVDVTGEEIAGEESEEVVDAVLLWWRDGDGDLVDALVDSLTDLDDGGAIWLLTPKVGRAGHVDPADITDAAPTAGLSTTSTLALTDDWSATKLTMPKSPRSKR